MANESRKIFVYENWSAENPQKIGILFVDNIRGVEHFSFSYDDGYLNRSRGIIPIDPELSLFTGRQYASNASNFGAFSDSAPDRWGRTLLDRRERLMARKENRKPRKLLESDYLLGIFDETRMGALRFAMEEDGPFLSSDSENTVPPWATLRTLEEASREFEKDENMLNDKWLNQLLKPGSSLGGARPKATVEDTDGSLWIAKFPSKHDGFNSGAWEKTVHDLASRCGIRVPPSRMETFSKSGSTFLVKRFDRSGKRRIHFASAMTMLGKKDGASASDGSGYLELAELIRSLGNNPKEDLLELWKRIVFNMAVSNTDDHLRNHGFLLSGHGWQLSPAYDINPTPEGDTLSLNVSPEDNSIDIDLAIETSSFYGLTKKEAIATANSVCSIVRTCWEAIARRYGISRVEMEMMRPAFLASNWEK